jgi:hypothetical protein
MSRPTAILFSVNLEIINMVYKTKVVRLGAFWKVQYCVCGQWLTFKDCFCTRAEARNAQFWVARF